MRNPTLWNPWDAKLIWGDVIYTLDTRSRRIGWGTCFLLSSYREDFGPVSTSPPNCQDWCAGEQEIQGKNPNAVVRAKVWCRAVICSHQKEGEEAYWKVRRVRSVSSERKPGRQPTGNGQAEHLESEKKQNQAQNRQSYRSRVNQMKQKPGD